eukprot:215186-Amphidinium_carterae.1
MGLVGRWSRVCTVVWDVYDLHGQAHLESFTDAAPRRVAFCRQCHTWLSFCCFRPFLWPFLELEHHTFKAGLAGDSSRQHLVAHALIYDMQLKHKSAIMQRQMHCALEDGATR